MTHFAATSGVSPVQLGEVLHNGVKHRADVSSQLGQLQERVVRMNADYQKAVQMVKQKHNDNMAKDKEILKLRTDSQRKEAELRAEAEHLRARLTLAENNMNAAAAEHARTVSKYAQAMDATKLALEKSRDQVRSREADMEKMKNFLDQRVPLLCQEAITDCKKAMLMKIRGTYPDADMAYFSRLSDVPDDVEIEADWLVEPDEEEEDGAAENTAGQEEEQSREVVAADEGSRTVEVAPEAQEAQVDEAAVAAGTETTTQEPDGGTAVPINVD